MAPPEVVIPSGVHESLAVEVRPSTDASEEVADRLGAETPVLALPCRLRRPPLSSGDELVVDATSSWG